MDDFEHFVEGLGPHAKHYTQAELKRLHLEVQQFATLVLEAYRARLANHSRRSPQASLDDADTDRTIESVLVERVEDKTPP